MESKKNRDFFSASDLNLADLAVMLESQPSTCTSKNWIYQSVKCGFKSTDVSGKWCILRSASDIDTAWRKICRHMGKKELLNAKVSTFRNRKLTGFEHHVICVYTYDWNDLDDVHRARDLLRQIGFVEPLNYKRDIESRNPNPDFEFIYCAL